MKRIVTMLAVLVFTLPAMGAKEWFVDLGYDAAFARAAKENKLVFIDFYTTWCQPCKMMDESTFKDDAVVKWLSDNAVAIKIDAEAKEEIALKHKVDGYPTLIFLKADGTEFERVSGYIPPEDLLRIFRLVETGKTTLIVAKQNLDKSPNDPVAHLDYAAELTRRSRWEDAWAEYNWCLDNGVKNDPEFEKYGADALLSGMIELGGPLERARLELMKLRNESEQKFRDGKGSMIDGHLIRDVNNAAGEDLRTLEFYDSIVEDGDKDEIETLSRAMMPLLVRAQRFDEVEERVKVVDDARRVLANAVPTADYLGKYREPEEREMFREIFNENAALRVSDHYQVLLATGKKDEAAELAAAAMKASESPAVYGALSWAGYLSGKPVEQNIAWARKALDMMGGESAEVVDTLARLLDKLGRKEEAIKVCRAALEKSDDLRSKLILQGCLDEINGEGGGTGS